LLKANHIQQVTAKSYEADDEPTPDFLLEQRISGNGSLITTTTGYPSTGRSVSSSFYINDRISKTADSSENIKSTTTYVYDGNNIASITTITEDVFMENSLQEIHLWLYQNNLPVKMLLIKNNTDTTVIDLIKDGLGNVAEEHWKKKGRTIEKYFYYYNDQHLLTDIVRFNTKARQLLPEYILSYNNTGTLTQFTQVPQNSSDYLIWQYTYLPGGLKEKELCLNKQNHILGRIEYSYK
ncbi:MAG TPA: hypothetical protein PLA68_12570, partial [Panacibacter sp.]|nr:hypothetical protein [Panacibacter sp.]